MDKEGLSYSTPVIPSYKTTELYKIQDIFWDFENLAKMP